jgi:hypothetical protein
LFYAASFIGFSFFAAPAESCCFEITHKARINHQIEIDSDFRIDVSIRCTDLNAGTLGAMSSVTTAALKNSIIRVAQPDHAHRSPDCRQE